MRRNALVCFALAAITIALYWPVRNYGLVEFDDPEFVREKPEITSGLTWQGFRWAFANPVAANWHPLTTLSHMLDCQVFDRHLGAHHLVSVGFHALNGVLLFLLLTRMTSAFWRSAIVAAIFAWHPLRVESVVWIAERKDVLSGLFFLLTLLAYTKYVQSQSKSQNPTEASHLPYPIFYVLTLLLFSLGLMSKPMLVTLPFVMLLLDFWPLERLKLGLLLRHPAPLPSPLTPRPSHLLLEKVPLFALAAAACWITIYLQKGGMPTLASVPLHDRVANAIISYLRYLGNLSWPSNLSIIYPHPSAVHPLSAEWPDWQVGLIGVVLLAISALCLRQAINRPYLAVGWFWYLGMMVPVIGIVQVGEQALADRYTYLPLIGPTISLVWLFADFVDRKVNAPRNQPAGTGTLAKSRNIAFIVPILLLVACGILTIRQVGYWRDTYTLFAHAAKVTRNNATAEFFIGLALEKRGDTDGAAAHYRAAISINPHEYASHYNLAQILRKSGQWLEAAEHYEAVLQARPKDLNSLLNLANILPNLGRSKEAITQYDQVLQLDPDSIEVANNLAWLLATSPDAEIRNGTRAVQLAERACELTQYKMTTLVGTLAAAYAEAGRFADAIATEEKACALAVAAGEKELEQKNRELLALYYSGHPYREPAASLGPSSNN